MMPVSTLTLMKTAPVAAAIPRAERASLRRTLTPIGTPVAFATPVTATVIAETVSEGTVSAKKGVSPKFSIMRAGNPASTRTEASETAIPTTSSIEPLNPGEPGSGSR